MKNSRRLEELLLIAKSIKNSKYYLEIGPKLQNTFNFLNSNTQKYGLISFISTLEYFKDPKLVLTKSRLILSKGGSIFIVVPNDKSFLVRHKKRKNKNYFTTKSIKLLLKQSGYETRYMTTFDEINDFKKSFKKNTAELRWFSILLYCLFRKIFWLLGRGGYICVVAGR